MSKRPDPELIDDENPEWTADEVSRAKRFSDLPTSLQSTLKARARPKAAVVKERLTIRLDPQALVRWRASGPGWQTRAAALLAAKAPKG
ncbi:MAG: BrnA antitoxin family protein [Rubrivivax sp.]|nr:BrnA antitoxin family protein [Rubrivivax sp.]